MCAHPAIDKDPVRVEIIGDDGVIRKELFTDYKWKNVVLKSEELGGTDVLTFQVSRTWNPKLAGVSEDSRDLGVAVAVLRTD